MTDVTHKFTQTVIASGLAMTVFSRPPDIRFRVFERYYFGGSPRNAARLIDFQHNFAELA